MSRLCNCGQLLISIAAGWCAAVQPRSYCAHAESARELRSEVWQHRRRAQRPTWTHNAIAAAVCLSYKYLPVNEDVSEWRECAYVQLAQGKAGLTETSVRARPPEPAKPPSTPQPGGGHWASCLGL